MTRLLLEDLPITRGLSPCEVLTDSKMKQYEDDESYLVIAVFACLLTGCTVDNPSVPVLPESEEQDDPGERGGAETRTHGDRSREFYL